GERSTAAWSIPGIAQSAALAVAAATLSRASWRGRARPTRRSGVPRATVLGATVSAIAVMSPCVGLDRVEDLGGAGAAAEVTPERPANLVAARARVALEEGQRSEQHPRGAEPTLDGAVPDERLLERTERPVA